MGSSWSRERLPSPRLQGYPDVPPDLAVEVVDGLDGDPDLLEKIREYLAAGVRLLWVVRLEDRIVASCRPGQKLVVLRGNDTLSGEDVVPGFSCKVADFFP